MSESLKVYLMAILAATTLFLAAVGIYGAIWYSVVEKSTEFRIRLALGAFPGDIIRLMFREVLPWVSGGILIGITGA